MTFNSPGYTIKDGWIKGRPTGLKITTNADATISSTLSAYASSAEAARTLTKDGPGALSVTGTNFFGTLRVNEGEYRVAGSSNLFASKVIIADAAGAGVTLAISSTVMSTLSGGGISGGFVQPSNDPGLKLLNVSQAGTFHGVLRDNGAGTLGVEFDGDQVLTNVNTYSGRTQILKKLTLSGTGSILNSAEVQVYESDTLVLDNTVTTKADRLSDTGKLILQNGELQMQGNAGVALEEVVGSLSLYKASKISIATPGAETLLTFSTLTRQNHATLNILSNGVKLGGVTNGANGIVSPWLTRGDDWAEVGTDGRVTAFTGYTSDINSGTSIDNVRLNGATTALNDSVVRSTLKLQNAENSIQVLNLNAKELALGGGGILTSGGASRIEGGRINSLASELIVTARSNLTIDAEISESGTSASPDKNRHRNFDPDSSQHLHRDHVDRRRDRGRVARRQSRARQLDQSRRGNASRGERIFLNKGDYREWGLDTGVHNVTFSGKVSGFVSKSGTGKLTLTNVDGGAASVSNGTLALPSANASGMTIWGRKLEASGRVGHLSYVDGSQVDIGPFQPATLSIGYISQSVGSGNLTFLFDLGSVLSDLLVLDYASVSQPSSGGYYFSFRNLGGVSTGVDYTIMQFTSPSFSTLPIGLSPNHSPRVGLERSPRQRAV